MDDEIEYEQEVTGEPIGTQLKEAREAKGISLEDMAAKSRIPKRHIENLEANDWEKLPAATYAAGFAKTHASMTGLDPAWAAQSVREAMGAHTPEHATTTTTSSYQIDEEKRGIPGWLIVVAILAVVVAILGFSYLNDQRLAADDEPLEEEAVDPEPDIAPEPAEPVVDADTPVTLVASRAVWLRVTDGSEVLIARELSEGEEFSVPATAEAPELETARPASLRARFGDREVGFPGEDGTFIDGISLLAPDLAENPTGTP